MQKFDYDVAVLGGGSAGYAAARTAAGAGLKTAVIEGGEEVGGLCILRGCMPTKALLYAAEVMHLASHAGPWGIRAENVSFDFTKVMARKDALIKDFADYRRQQLAGGKFKFIRANARFLDPHTVELTWEADLPVGQDARQRVPTKITATKFHHCHRLKRRAAAPALAPRGRLHHQRRCAGAQAVAEVAHRARRRADCVRIRPIFRAVRRQGHAHPAQRAHSAGIRHGRRNGNRKGFRREGIQVFTGTKLVDARRKGKIENGFVSSMTAKPFPSPPRKSCSRWAACPTRQSLDLEKAGVKTERGRIVANDFMQTSAPHIYAAGDCTGPHEIVHLAVQQGEIAAYNIAHANAPRRMDYRLLIAVVFTEPQVAFVGLTEKEAKARGISFLAASYPFNDHGKSLIMEAKDGFVKLLADPKSGEILGGACVGPVGGELIHEIVAAMAKRMTVQELAAMPHYHPTLAEIWTYPAEELAGQISDGPATRSGGQNELRNFVIT